MPGNTTLDWEVNVEQRDDRVMVKVVGRDDSLGFRLMEYEFVHEPWFIEKLFGATFEKAVESRIRTLKMTISLAHKRFARAFAASRNVGGA